MFIDWFSLIIGLLVGYVGAVVMITWCVVRTDRPDGYQPRSSDSPSIPPGGE